MTLASYTSPALIIPELRGIDARSVIQELSVALQQEGRIADLLPFYQAALNREYLCSTVTEPGWALPHVLVKGLDRPCFAFGRTAAPIAWGGSSGWRVQLIFLLAVPATDARAYVTVLAGLQRLSKHRELIERLLKAKDSFEIFQTLNQVSLRDNTAPAQYDDPVST